MPYMGVAKYPKKGLGSVHIGIYAMIVCHFIDIIAYLLKLVNGCALFATSPSQNAPLST